jgi:hypothetical protein
MRRWDTTMHENGVCMVSRRNWFIFDRSWVVFKLQVEMVAVHGFPREVENVASIGRQCREDYLGHDDANDRNSARLSGGGPAVFAVQRGASCGVRGRVLSLVGRNG